MLLLIYVGVAKAIVYDMFQYIHVTINLIHVFYIHLEKLSFNTSMLLLIFQTERNISS